MTLTLRIDNFDQLDDGGPVWLTLNERGASVGRRASMDWVLPDPAKRISGHHFDIQFSDGHYWLRDVSTNGTYLQGSAHRIEGPQRLAGGERLIVGHYVISVTLGQGQAAPVASHGAPAQAAGPMIDDSDPWDFSSEPLQPIDPLPQRGASPHHFDDAAQELVPLQRPSDPGGMAAGAAPVQQPGFGGGGVNNTQGVQQPPSAPAPMSPPPQVPPLTLSPISTPQDTPLPPRPSTPAPPPEAAPPRSPAPQPEAAAPPASADRSANGVIEAFCKGAGLPPQAAEGVDPLELVEMLGKTARVSVPHIMSMLTDRANVKKETRSGERTMTGAAGNNPMKFLPDAEQAFAAMFLTPRQGFMKGPEGFEESLKDLRHHQIAIFAALQPALAEVLADIAPEAIEAGENGGSLLSGARKGKLWDAFVERWDEKASAGEHGMLDAFLQAFSRAYTDAVRKRN